MAPVSFPAALALASLQLDVPLVVDAVCHFATNYGHGVCLFREVFAATSEAYQVAPQPPPAYMYRPATTQVSGGLLSPSRGNRGNSARGPAGCQEGAFIASLDTLERGRNPLRCPHADLASGRVTHTGEHPLLIIVPRLSYETLYEQMVTPQRVRPIVNNGRLEITGIDVEYEPLAHRGLRLEELLGPG